MKLDSAESNSEEFNSKVAAGSLLLLIAYAAVRQILFAEHRPFWYDELCTWILARQPSVSAIWAAQAQAADSQPPLYYVLERAFDTFISNDHIAFRLPSMLAFCFMVWCLFVWVKKRHGAGVAFIAALLPLTTVLYGTYSAEARPYTLIPALLAAALVAYQRVPALGWSIVLGSSLVAAQFLHYYSILMMAPFFATEAFFFAKTKLFRWPVWGALAAAILAVIPFWAMGTRLKTVYGTHYWSPPDPAVALRTYGWFFALPVGDPGAARPGMMAVVLAGDALVAACLIFALVLLVQALRANPSKTPFFHEHLLAAAFLLLPVIAYYATRVMHGGLAPRYLTATILGVVLAAASALGRLKRQSLALICGALVSVFVLQEASFWISYHTSSLLGFSRSHSVEQLVRGVDQLELPVVISDAHDYLESVHYAEPQWKGRFVFLADPAAAVAHGNPDGGDRQLLILRGISNLQVFGLDKFKTAGSKFLFYADPSPENSPDWRLLALKEQGYVVRTVAKDARSTLYLVEFQNRDRSEVAAHLNVPQEP